MIADENPIASFHCCGLAIAEQSLHFPCDDLIARNEHDRHPELSGDRGADTGASGAEPKQPQMGPSRPADEKDV
jgi:hypothetical protein